MQEQEIEWLARARIEANANMCNTDHLGGDAFVYHSAAIRAECAFADAYHLPYDTIRKVCAGSDGGNDFVIHFDGWPMGFDVKARTGQYPDLLVKAEKYKPGVRCAHCFVLAHVHDTRVKLVGWEHKDFVRCVPAQKLRTVSHLFPQRHLRPMWTLNYIMGLRDGLERRA